jgi:AcrR family transcriptional regulator
MAQPVAMPEADKGLRARKKRELKDELSRHAMKLFIQNGFDQTTIEQIVDPLGVSTRTFFRYFPAKEDLIFAWYEELTGELVQSLVSRPSNEAPFEAVCQALRSLLRYYDRDAKWALAMLRLAKQTPLLVGKSHEKRSMWEAALATALLPRLPKAVTRELRAKVIVGSAMAAFGYGVDAWSEAKAKGDLRRHLDLAFSFVKEL